MCRPLRRSSEIVGDRELGSIGAAGDLGLADEHLGADAREQLESDEVNGRRPVANRADHLGRARAVKTRVSAVSELILPGRGSGSKSATAIVKNATSIEQFSSRSFQGLLVVGDGSDLERHQVQPVAHAFPFLPESPQAIDLGGRLGRIELESGRSQKGSRAAGVWMCQTVAFCSRQASVIAAANRPDETLVSSRTSSIGATVPPPVTTTFVATELTGALFMMRPSACVLCRQSGRT